MEDKVSYNVYLLNGELCKLEKIQYELLLH